MPCVQDERERIEELGGLVIWLGAWRVNGNLSVSRAIGDGKDKKFITANADTVSSSPHPPHPPHPPLSSQNSVELDGSEDFLVVACDGVWDVLSAEEMGEEVGQHFSSGGTKQSLAQGLIEAAKREGSGDNMTVIVVYFDTFKMPTAPPSKPEVGGDNKETQEVEGAPKKFD